jgi:hypothetical protein
VWSCRVVDGYLTVLTRGHSTIVTMLVFKVSYSITGGCHGLLSPMWDLAGWSVRKHSMSCRLCRWAAPTKQIVCKGTMA